MNALEGFYLLIIVTVLILIGALIGVPIGGHYAGIDTANEWKAIAVKHGCGEFVITDTLAGISEFKWGTP